MVTRVRIEAEGRDPQEVASVLQAAHEHFVQNAPPSVQHRLFGGDLAGLADAQAGEFVIERFARDCWEYEGEGYSKVKAGPGHGAIFYRGRMTSHFAAPSKPLKLDKRSEAVPYVTT